MPNAKTHQRGNVLREVSYARSERARDALVISPRCELMCMTYGQFSLVDALSVILQQTGPAAVSVATWTAAEADLTRAEQFLREGAVTSLRFLVDRSFETRQPSYCAALRRLFGDTAIRTTRSHAKFATIRNAGWDLVVRTSMNLNHNPRLENIEVSDDPGFADFVDSVFDEVWRGQPPGVFNGELPALRAQAGLRAGVARSG